DRICANLYPRTHQSRSSVHWTCAAGAAEAYPHPDGNQGSGNSRQLSQRDLQRSPAFGAWRRDYFPISAVIRGPDLNQLAEVSKKIANRMRAYPDLVDVNPSLNLNTPELQVQVDRQRAADIGVSMTDISDAVRLFYSGEDEITRFKEGSEQYPVTMQLLPEQRDNPDILNQMMVPSSKLGQVRLENVASIGRGFGPATLWRYNREFQVSVYANVNTGYPLDLGAAHTIQSIQEVGLPAGYSYLFSGQVKVLEETTWNLLLAMLLASVFMYMVLAAQFESFTYPFIILLTLPLSVPFAL